MFNLTRKWDNVVGSWISGLQQGFAQTKLGKQGELYIRFQSRKPRSGENIIIKNYSMLLLRKKYCRISTMKKRV